MSEKARTSPFPEGGGKVCNRPFADILTVEQTAIGRPFHILCRCGSNHSACKVMIEATGFTIKTIPDPAHIASCACAGRF